MRQQSNAQAVVKVIFNALVDSEMQNFTDVMKKARVSFKIYCCCPVSTFRRFCSCLTVSLIKGKGYSTHVAACKLTKFYQTTPLCG